ncbi:hypothetical protein Cgig2_025263 [Carnegiea gigantea]|uniref:Uncharacterized protein n=1 Tax=Carnegiea gigantea TaxID=171969 RepID=A0A9Q1JPG9_9CARY|nr:hypothetical protein Cgig2_025263 [Carnegiea gigantea]
MGCGPRIHMMLMALNNLPKHYSGKEPGQEHVWWRCSSQNEFSVLVVDRHLKSRQASLSVEAQTVWLESGIPIIVDLNFGHPERSYWIQDRFGGSKSGGWQLYRMPQMSAAVVRCVVPDPERKRICSGRRDGHLRGDMSMLKKLLKFVRGEIADTNGFSKAKTLTLFHGFPNRFQVNRRDEVLGDGLLNRWPLAQF